MKGKVDNQKPLVNLYACSFTHAARRFLISVSQWYSQQGRCYIIFLVSRTEYKLGSNYRT